MAVFKPAGPPRFKHQIQGLKDIIANKGVHALLFDPGTGKTATTLDYVSLLALKSPVQHAKVLVIAPLPALDSWVKQAPVFISEGVTVHAEAVGGSGRQKADVLKARGAGNFTEGIRRAIAVDRRVNDDDTTRVTLLGINFDAFASRRSTGNSQTMADVMVKAVKDFAPDLIVVDESHRIKGYTSNTSKAIARLTDVCRRRIILTGTVMPHSPMDVYGQWRFLQPLAFSRVTKGGLRVPMSFGHFRRQFAVMGGFMNKEVTGYRNLDVMQDVMSQNATVAKKEECLDLPDHFDIEVPVHLTPAEIRAYAAMRDKLAVKFGADGDDKAVDPSKVASVPNRLAQIMRLRQITSGYLPKDDGTVETLGPGKIATIKSIVNETLEGEQRVVVFAHFIAEVEALAAALETPGTVVESISGKTDNRERIAIRERFGRAGGERRILVAQMRTMSLAVNELVSASHAVYASLSERRDDMQQSRDRLDRIGQTRKVTFWYAVAPDTVDEILLSAYRNRTDLESALLKHIRKEDS